MLARLAAALEYLFDAIIATHRSSGCDPATDCVAVAQGSHGLLLELSGGGLSLLELLLLESSTPELPPSELLSIELEISLEPESPDELEELSSDDDSEDPLPLEELGGQTVYVYSSPIGQSTGTQISREVTVKQPFSSSDTFVMIVIQLHGSPEPESPEVLLLLGDSDELSLPLEEDTSLLEESTDELDSDDSLLELSPLELSLDSDELSLLESEELLSEELLSEELLSDELDPSGQQSTSFS